MPLREVLKRGELVEFRDKHLITRSGQRMRVAGNIAPVREVGGQPSGAVIVFESVAGEMRDPFPSPLLARMTNEHGTLEFGRFHVIATTER